MLAILLIALFAPPHALPIILDVADNNICSRELKSFSNSVDNSKRKLNESKMATAQAKNELESFSNENKEAATNAKVAMDAAAREAKKAENAYDFSFCFIYFRW